MPLAIISSKYSCALLAPYLVGLARPQAAIMDPYDTRVGFNLVSPVSLN